MNTNNIFLPTIMFLGFAFFSSCVGDASSEGLTNAAADAATELVSNKVDSTEIKRIAEEEAAAEEEAKLEEERLAMLEAEREKAEKDSIRRAKRKLAKLRKIKEEERRKAAAAAALEEEVVVSQPVILPPSQPTTPPPSKPVTTKANGAKIDFVQKTYNFGTIQEGDVVKYEFEYTNTGTEPLIIKDASATCGCTAPGFSFFPLDPGLSSAISVTFNSANKAGAQKPEVTIITNGYPSRHVLTMEGNVVK